MTLAGSTRQGLAVRLPIDTLQPAADINQDWRWCWEHWPYLDDTEKPR